jgi:hypothetical protein
MKIVKRGAGGTIDEQLIKLSTNLNLKTPPTGLVVILTKTGV